MNPFRYDFGYTWQFTYLHLMVCVLGLIVLVWSLRTRRSKVWIGAAGTLAVWGLIGFLIVQFGMRLNLPMELPTDRFLVQGAGRVLDVGSGSGRAALMVLLARPNTDVVALDIFQEGYGIDGNSPGRLLKNAELAGVRNRIAVQSADMRSMPFAPASFDAAVSAYAIDHMRHEDSIRALSEVNRVLKPGGDLLLELMHADVFIHVAYPILGAHGFFGPSNAEARWRGMVESSGFEVVESGRTTGTIYVLARKRAS